MTSRLLLRGALAVWILAVWAASTGVGRAAAPDTGTDAQRERYRARRAALRAALAGAGWRIDHSEAGLYLWAAHPDHDCWSAAELLAAQCGILVTPGELYGPTGTRHIRVALTATDERVSEAVRRLAALNY